MKPPEREKLLKAEDQFLAEINGLLEDEERFRSMSDVPHYGPEDVGPEEEEKEEKELTPEEFGDSEPDDAVDAEDNPENAAGPA